MSAILLPIAAIGGIYLAFNALAGKTKKHRSDHNATTSSTETDTSHQRKRSKSQTRKSNLFSLQLSPSREKERKREEDERKNKKLFVFYSFGEKNKDWDYKNLPPTWKMKRRVLSSNQSVNYRNVDVFEGENKYKEKMKEYLETAFHQLKEAGIVKKYNIRSISTPY